MEKKFWFRITALIVLVTILGFYRVSPNKVKEQNIIVELQAQQTSTSIRFFQVVSDSISFISLGIPALFLAYGLAKKKKVLVRSGLIVLLGIGLGGLISYGLKQTIQEPRPYQADSRITKWSGGGSDSFPSGHTVEATAAAIGFSVLLFKTPVAVFLSTIWALLIMSSRVVLGVHNFTDIFGGIVVGGMGFLIIQHLSERYPTKTA